MKVTQVVSGRFHHFHLARQLHQRGLLDSIWTGYPRTKLRDEQGIPPERILTAPMWYTAYVLSLRSRMLRSRPSVLNWFFRNQLDAIDKAASKSLHDATILVALSGSGLTSGRRARQLGGRWVCDRGSSHIAYQRELLSEEYARWGAPAPRFDDAVIAKELQEYAEADCITVPSRFVADSFIERGVARDKIRLIPYGGRLDRFSPVAKPDPQQFTVLFVGGISVRKGVPYLLEAFARLRHPRKRLKIIGSRERGMDRLLERLPTEGVEFLGQVPNGELPLHYSTADVMVLPSIEEGLAMVMGEALACGCPVIASRNTGASELFDHGSEGSIVAIRDVDALVDAMTALADDPVRAAETREAAARRIGRIGGWSDYGDRWADLVSDLRSTV